VEYPRGARLLDRLAAWERLIEAAQEETQGLAPGKYLVVDPDSRLTQLGMLPVVEDDGAHAFFESRSYGSPGRTSLAELAAAWADEVFGGTEPAPLPWVSFPAEAVESARRCAGGGRWAAVNLGVGDNPRKRIGGGFEEKLLRGLLEAGWRIFLDTGGGGEEAERVESLLARLGAPEEVVAWRGSLAGFGALIGESRLYVGYDSAAGHIAAALGTPVVDIFAGYSSPRMLERWRPAGPGKVTLIDAERADPDEVLRQVLEAAR
jgi:ADP-heptose:LPS heptosyltransferase